MLMSLLWIADVITELPSSEEDDAKLLNSLEESWIVTQEPNVAPTPGGATAATAATAQSRNRIRQPKGTKPRRLRLGKKPAATSNANYLTDVGDADSISSSIAIIPSPEHRAVPASSSPVLNASLSHAKQMAAIASSRVRFVCNPYPFSFRLRSFRFYFSISFRFHKALRDFLWNSSGLFQILSSTFTIWQKSQSQPNHVWF